jgi:hypothetical protein
VAGQRGELVGRALEGRPVREPSSAAMRGAKVGMRIQAGADRGAAGRQQQQAGQGARIACSENSSWAT